MTLYREVTYERSCVHQAVLTAPTEGVLTEVCPVLYRDMGWSVSHQVWPVVPGNSEPSPLYVSGLA